MNGIRDGYDVYHDITTITYYINNNLHRFWFYGNGNYKPNFYSTFNMRVKLKHDLSFMEI